MSNIQVVNLADNINAAVLKINQNFAGIEAGDIGGGLDSSEVVGVIVETVDSAYVNNLVDISPQTSSVDSADITNIVNNILDSDYFITVINQEYLEQFTINTDVSYLDSDISANASAIFQLTSRIDATDSGLTAVVSSVDSLSLTLDQFITDGIEITPEQVTSALGGALDELTLRLDADSDKLVIEAAKIVDLETGLIAQNSDLGSQINAVSNAQSSLVSRTEFDSAEGRITTLAEDIVTLNSQVDITNADGSLSQAIADTESTLRGEITVVDGRITSVETSLTNTLNAKIDSDIAAATETLTALIDSAGNTVSTWGIDLVAGTENDPKVAGIKFGNDGTTADFAITTDTFKILPTDGSGNGTAPFSVVGGVVELSDAKVTGQIDVTTSDNDGSMNITGNLITISDGAGTPRVKLGNLS